MQVDEEHLTWPFDVSKTKLSPKFMAGRGRVLLEISKSPLYAQEFAKRKIIQEMLIKGELKLDQKNIPTELLRMNSSYTLLKKAESHYIREPVINQKEFKNDLSTSVTTPQTNFKTDKMQYNSNTSEQGDKLEEKSVKNKILPLSTSAISNKCSIRENSAKDYSRKNGIGAKPLRKPEKSRKQYVTPPEKMNNVSVTSQSNSNVEESREKVVTSGNNVWVDWENSVIVHGSLDDEDLPEIATVEDNDDIHDVIVNQYIDALQHEQTNKIPEQNRKITPNRVQQFSKLKSTTNADCLRVSPGTQPNLPKGDDRWGGSELNGMSANTGWGTFNNGNRNQYDDGSSMWSAEGSQYGGANWSNAS
ncbi:uncharacterized protein LOC116300208 [Actinia tenebrosa]|uniref:Uncharacterized protein LOC116300208 n=1 Tax=Actinia tenebrosa TaxID=6105 RepID=A0A6P8I9Z8_ACTTE|nr:uncharacterized protein LOC116300208 [Actinia tenebrosa]